MTDEQPQGRDRRVHERYDIALSIDFEITTDGVAAPRLRGNTINVSRGGLLADIGVRTAVDVSCVVTFRDAQGLIAPLRVTGHVVHVGMWTHGREAVAVQFDAPLERLELSADA